MNHLVQHYYHEWDVSSPRDISLYLWDRALEITVTHRPGRTLAIYVGNVAHIFCDGCKPLPLRRVEIAHEIGHALLHSGQQTDMRTLLRGSQEHSADAFSMEALIPGYLLSESLSKAPDGRGQTEQYIAELYGVPLPFAARRLDVFYGDYPAREMVAETVAEYDCVMRDPIDRRMEYYMWNTGAVVGAIKHKTLNGGV